MEFRQTKLAAFPTGILIRTLEEFCCHLLFSVRSSSRIIMNSDETYFAEICTRLNFPVTQNKRPRYTFRILQEICQKI